MVLLKVASCFKQCRIAPEQTVTERVGVGDEPNHITFADTGLINFYSFLIEFNYGVS